MPQKTETSLDNILLTFAAGLAKLGIVVGAVMSLSYLWSLPTSGLIAGLGISGLAVAFASKETLSNIFGAGILLGDRPFGKGDRIIAGDINGWVEAVGLRSTRIRTLHDSLLIVPNGKLADMPVNNLGARRRRSFSTTLLVTSGATPQRLQALTEGIKACIAGNPIFDARSTEVRISGITADGIDGRRFGQPRHPQRPHLARGDAQPLSRHPEDGGGQRAEARQGHGAERGRGNPR